MATIAIGNSITPTGTGANDGKPDPSQVRTLTLTNGAKPFDAVVSCTANATTTLWTAATNAAASTTAAADLVLVSVDPAEDEETSLPVDLILTYTQVSPSTTATAQTTAIVAKREHGVLAFGGEGRTGTTQKFLTKIEVNNRNTGTDDAVKVRVQVWN